MKQVLLVGRQQGVIDGIVVQLQVRGVRLQGGTGLETVRTAFAQGPVDHVIVGGGLELETRLQIVREIFMTSMDTTVHMNSPSGPQSFLPFVTAVVNGVKDL